MAQTILQLFKRLVCEDEGATAVEYAVMLAVILISCIAAVLNTGEMQGELWDYTSDTFSDALPGSQL